jgi:hypothetical protein
MKMSQISVNLAKEMILDKLEEKIEDGRKPMVEFRNIYKGKKKWSTIFFKAGHELDEENENLEIIFKRGFHRIVKTEN